MQIMLECLLMVLLFQANLIFLIILHYGDPIYGIAPEPNITNVI